MFLNFTLHYLLLSFSLFHFMPARSWLLSCNDCATAHNSCEKVLQYGKIDMYTRVHSCKRVLIRVDRWVGR